MAITVKELKQRLNDFKDETEVEVLIGFRFVAVRAVNGDDDDGAYIETEEGS